MAPDLVPVGYLGYEPCFIGPGEAQLLGGQAALLGRHHVRPLEYEPGLVFYADSLGLAGHRIVMTHQI